MLVVLTGALAIWSQALVAAEKSVEEKFRQAIRDGKLEKAQELSSEIDVKKMPNLTYHVLGSPNAKLVEWLKAKYELRISELQIAAVRGDVKKIRAIVSKLDKDAKALQLSEGYSPPIVSYSPLSIAVRNGQTKAVEVLIELGANVNESTHYTLTPLGLAAELGHNDIVAALLKAGAKVNDAPDGYTALMRACWGGQPKAAEMLITAGANVNMKRHDDQRALHMAAKKGSAPCVRLLLQNGAEPDALASGRDTALSYAELYKHKEVVKLLER